FQYGTEKFGAGCRHPLARPSARCSCWYVPGGRERAEMIEADHVYVSQKRAKAVYAPTIPCPPKSVPIIDRISPELSFRTEVIGRNAGDESRPATIVEQEQLRISPDVARIGGNEEG